MMEVVIRGAVFLIGKRKWAVSKDVTSKPTKAQGARMTRLNTA